MSWAWRKHRLRQPPALFLERPRDPEQSVEIARLKGELAAAQLEIGRLQRENAALRREIVDADNAAARQVNL